MSMSFEFNSISAFVVACLVTSKQNLIGGELQVVELLEDQAKKEIETPLLEENRNQSKTFRNFILHPSFLGMKLFTIIKFGLVQYVNPVAFTHSFPFFFLLWCKLRGLNLSGFLTDDFEGCLCTISTCPGAMWSVW